MHRMADVCGGRENERERGERAGSPCYHRRVNAPVSSEDIPRDVVELCRKLAEHGYRAWVVGGCLRDLLLGRRASDWDLATDARPEQVQRVFPKVLPTGIQHGTVTVRLRGESYEVTTLRGEGAYSDGRRPDSVSFVSDIEEDLARRDFTVNAMAYDPLGRALVDPFGGERDLEARVLRAVGEAEQRFSEDGLRVLRAARFCATLEFELEAATESAIGRTLHTFRKVSAERVRDEWMKAFKARAPSLAFAVMRRTGILAVTAVELQKLSDDMWRASLAAMDALPSADPILRLTALLWPLADSPDALGEWLTQYRFSNQERERVLRLLVHVRRDHDGSDGALRRLAASLGRSHVADLGLLGVELAAAHSGASSKELTTARSQQQRLAALIDPSVALSTRELQVSGKDLMQSLALAPGPKLGQLLEGLLDKVLDEPRLNERETLLEMARQML